MVPAETPSASSQPPAEASTEPLPAATETPSVPLTEPSPSPCATQQPTPEPRIRPESIPAQPISQMRSANGGASYGNNGGYNAAPGYGAGYGNNGGEGAGYGQRGQSSYNNQPEEEDEEKIPAFLRVFRKKK